MIITKRMKLVATIKTDELGIARTDDLPLGKYYVVEKETADGFVLDGEPRDIDLTYRDQDTPVVTFDSEWQNSRQKAKVIVTKKEKDSDRVLEGGVFALCAKEDIKNTDGDVLVKADTIMEQKATDKDGKIFSYCRSSGRWQLLCEGSKSTCRFCYDRRSKRIYFRVCWSGCAGSYF